MERVSLQTEKLLYAVVVLAALILRLAALGNAPLSDAEARLALQALGIMRHAHPTLGAQPGLAALTSLVFALFGGTDALARLVPALAGGFLPLLAWGTRRHLGRLAAFLFACALAFDPGLVALSRVANSPVPALLLGMGALLAFAHARWEYALPLAVLGALLGASFWFGLVGVLIIAVLARPFAHVALSSKPKNLKNALEGAFWALVLGGTLMYWAPGVLGASLNSLVAFLTPRATADAASMSEALFILGAYAPLATGSALVGAALALRVEGEERRAARLLLLAAVLMPALALLYPHRPIAFLAWVLPAVWALAAWALARLPRLGLAGIIHSVLVLLLLTFILFNALGWSHTPPNSPAAQMRLALIGLTFLLILLATAMLAWGWTIREALGGVAWGFVAFGLILNLAALMRSAYGARPHELWYGNAASPNMRLLQQTVADFGNRAHGRPDTIELVDTTSLPSLAWDFRALHTFTASKWFSSFAKPEAVITAINGKPPRTAAYSGQDFRIAAQTVYPFPNLREAIAWLAFRSGETRSATVVLWIRTDLFAGRR